MEEGLLLKREKEVERSSSTTTALTSFSWRDIREEMKSASWLAGPMVVVIMSQYLLQVISTVMVGHLGQLYLSSTAIAVSLCSVTGISLMLGMSNALETLSGQAYGAQQYKKLGTQAYTAIFSLTLVCIPVSVLWIYMGEILVFLGQDPSISHEAGKYSIYLVPSLFATAAIHPLSRYLQTQSLIYPMVLCSCATLCLHIPICWALVLKSGLQNLGAATATSISMWLNVLFLATYMKYSSACAMTRSPLSMEIFHGVGEFFRYAVPSATMVCFEWWSFEILILLSGLLPHPELETSVLSVCLTTVATINAIPYGVGAAASVRVSVELGAGNPQGARTATCAVMVIAVANALVVSSLLFATRKIFGYTFSNEKEVVDYVTKMAPLICVNITMDSLQGVLSGVATGAGWQNIGAFVNLAAFYLVGIPLGATLGFWFHMRGRGLWIGIVVGSTVQTILLAIITKSTNWEHLAIKARQRIFEESPGVANGSSVDEQRP